MKGRKVFFMFSFQFCISDDYIFIYIYIYCLFYLQWENKYLTFSLFMLELANVEPNTTTLSTLRQLAASRNEYINRSFILYCLLFPPSVSLTFALLNVQVAFNCSVFFFLSPSFFVRCMWCVCECMSVSVVQFFFLLSFSIIITIAYIIFSRIRLSSYFIFLCTVYSHLNIVVAAVVVVVNICIRNGTLIVLKIVTVNGTHLEINFIGWSKSVVGSMKCDIVVRQRMQ